MKEEVRKMLEMGIIEASKSDYSSPPVAVKKSDGSCRFCIDFRKLNALTIFDAAPIPNPEVLINKIG